MELKLYFIANWIFEQRSLNKLAQILKELNQCRTITILEPYLGTYS